MYLSKIKPYLWPALVAVSALLAWLLWGGSPQAKPADADLSATPASFAGTGGDGTSQSEAGELVLDEGLRRLFDYHLAAVGELPLTQIVANIEAELDRQLPPKAAQAAKRLLKQYLEFKTALQALELDPRLSGDAVAALQARLATVRQLRSRYFSLQESAALFGWQDRYDDDALARRVVQADAALSAEQKRERLAELDRQAPPEILAARQAPVQHLALADSVAAARAKGADDVAVYRLRAETVGPEAAERLAALDREEAAWQGRIQRYQADLAAIRTKAGLSEAERQTAIEQLRQAQFDAQERLRLTAYE